MRVYLRFEAVCKKSGVAHLSPHLITRLKFDQKIAKAVAGYLEFILIKWLNPALLPHRIHPTRVQPTQSPHDWNPITKRNIICLIVETGLEKKGGSNRENQLTKAMFLGD